MTDSETPTGLCCCCARRDPEYGIVCHPCRSRLVCWIGDIADHVAELLDEEAARGEPTAVREGKIMVRGKYGTVLETTGPRDPIGYQLPGAPTPGLKAGGRVTGSKDKPLPIAVDRVDLLADARAVVQVREWPDDQIGHLAVASVLDFWAEDLRQHRGGTEHRPDPSVRRLVDWLSIRIDTACDDWLPVDEFFETVRKLRGALMAQLGLWDIPDYKQGIPCRCGMLTLVRHNGSSYVECSSCGLALTTDEYDEHVAGLLAEATQRKKEAA